MSLGKEPEEVSVVIDEFVLQLHRGLFEYKGINGDYLGEELHHQIGKQAFCHLLGFLDCFSERYQWEQGTGSEYLLRLGQPSEWLPFRHQIAGFKPVEARLEAIDSQGGTDAKDQLSNFLSKAGSCALEMLNNAAYIEKELGSIGLAKQHENAIMEVCSALVSTKHDVVTELHDLDELRAPAGSSLVQSRVERILGWLGEDTAKLHALVMSLESDASGEHKSGLAYLLVAESATNVLRSFQQVSEASDRYRAVV